MQISGKHEEHTLMIKEDQSHLFIGSSRFIFDDLDAIPKRMVTSRIDDSAEGPTYLRMDADVPDEGLEGGLCQPALTASVA